jgi:transposase
MGWTETARREHDRSGLRYASDCTDEEWAVIRPLLRRTSRVGRPRKHKARTLWGCDPVYRIDGVPMGATAQGLPALHDGAFTTVQYHFYRMRDNGLLVVINAVLVGWGRAL